MGNYLHFLIYNNKKNWRSLLLRQTVYSSVHQLLHHLPMNLRRFINKCVGSEQITKIKESAGQPVILRPEGL